MKPPSQGQRAIQHGDDNEKNIAMMLCRAGFLRVEIKGKHEKAIEELKEACLAPRLWEEIQGVYATQVLLCSGIHEDDVREDFLMYKREWPNVLALTAKHQYKSGSTTDKLEHVYAEIKEMYPCPCLVLLEGPMFTPPIIRRGEHHVQISNGKVARIMTSIGGFSRWLTDGSRYPNFQEKPPDLFK